MELKKKIGTKEVHLKKCVKLPCRLELFKIEGVDAVKEDFIRHEIVDKDGRFGWTWELGRIEDDAIIERTKEKYSLSSEEFDGIYELLKKNLPGFCSGCDLV